MPAMRREDLFNWRSPAAGMRSGPIWRISGLVTFRVRLCKQLYLNKYILHTGIFNLYKVQNSQQKFEFKFEIQNR